MPIMCMNTVRILLRILRNYTGAVDQSGEALILRFPGGKKIELFVESNTSTKVHVYTILNTKYALIIPICRLCMNMHLSILILMRFFALPDVSSGAHSI